MKLLAKKLKAAFEFYENEQLTHKANWIFGKKWRSKYRYELFDQNNTNVLAATVGKTPHIFSKAKITYLIEVPDEEEIEVVVEEQLKQYWKFVYKGDQYDFYGHVGYNKSLFKNTVQVASFKREKMDGDMEVHYTGRVEADLLMALVLLEDIRCAPPHDLRIDKERLEIEFRAADENWQAE